LSLLNELKRRNVFRVAIAYIVMAWLVMQVADVILNNIAAPGWVFQVILLLLGIGFVLTLFFAWAFEMTPEGLKREKDVDRNQSITHETGQKLNYTIIAVLVLALGYFAYDKFVLSEGREAALIDATAQAISEQAMTDEVAPNDIDKSIAVLPFVDMSPDKDQDYMSDGIAEELLNLLARIPELKVTSRSSAFSYKGKDFKINEVGRELNVAHILEGSVRKAGNQVRITAQLIRVDTDTHLWSETYDRQLDDIFAIQDEIAATVVEQLKVTLMGETPHVQETDPDAYTTYLLAQHQLYKRTRESYIEARELFEKAVEQDPNYAPAYAQLATLWLFESAGYGGASVTTEEAISLAEPLIDRALDLDPELADAWAAKGLIMRYGNNESGAISLFKKALKLNPSHSLAMNWLSLAYRETRRIRDELEILRVGHRLDPLSVPIASNLVRSLARFGYDEEADEVLEHLYNVNKGMHGAALSQALLLRGRYAKAVEAALNGEEELPGSIWTFYMAGYILAVMGEHAEAHRLDPWEGKWADFMVYLDENIRDPVQRLAQLRKYNTDELAPESQRSVMWAYLGAGDFANAESLARKRLESIAGDARQTDGAVLVLAIISFNQGERQKASAQIEILERVTDSNLADGDNFSLNYIIKAVAQSFRGEEASAYDYLAQAFEGKTPVPLESDSMFAIFTAMGWDENPRFRKLLEVWEAHNASELRKLFDLACNGKGFTVWKPLPESCEKYMTTGT